MQKQNGNKPAKSEGALPRFLAVMIAATMLIWMGAQYLGSVYNWDVRYAFLFDFAALAAFVWALVVTFQAWRRRRG